MNRPGNIDKYLKKYAVSPMRPLLTASVAGLDQAVVIPVLAESTSLFRTLSSIAANTSSELRRTLVICVVNNHRPPVAAKEEIRDNRVTLTILKELIAGRTPSVAGPAVRKSDLERIAGSGLRLGCIDASSADAAIPDRDGGVGTARKIGMDAALAVLNGRGPGGGVICCLDADTLVMENYLAAVHAHFSMTDDPAAVAGYAHQKPADPGLLAAICCYEIFLRAYVMGLAFAGSPYAFHAIGSTMSCTAEAYAAVRGMNRRTAAEDFHFLDKLAKLRKVGHIGTTTVFPSSRPSHRVPFGTGQRMLRFMNGGMDEYRLYDSRIFAILREWLSGMEADPDRDSEAILAAARKIHSGLKAYLDLSRFAIDWPVIRRNCPDAEHLRHQFHVWFDGLKTLRLVHHLSRSAFPPVPMFEGLKGLLDRMGQAIPSIAGFSAGIPEPDIQFRILEELRSLFPES
jgi:glycosyltransferase involved in cell wall biosynthesis